MTLLRKRSGRAEWPSSGTRFSAKDRREGPLRTFAFQWMRYLRESDFGQTRSTAS
ncbi:hypothetical protein ACTQV1_06745 [Paratractidigestivibacter faecalis]|uniref:hypothetical protein n=1 Tax=Paratractidigestivibacter faecalis TaxID=2292441 RepID=UPI003F974F89